MRRLFLCAMALGLAVAGTAQARQSDHSRLMMGHFQTLCADNNGDGAKAIQLARSADWAPIPAQVFQQEGSPFDDVTAYMNAEEGELMSMLLVGTLTETYEGVAVTMPVCATLLGDMGAPEDAVLATDLQMVVRDWLGMTPLRSFSDEGMEAFGFTLQEGARRGLSSDAAAMQAMLNGRLHVIATKREDGMAMVMYMRARLN
ncbi:MAG: hypothetical protein REJ23_16095 [Brevundimonas sp.]|nr:hypothetical protein [Brevundimonas sp.]